MRNFGTAFRNYFNGTAENSIEYSVSVDSLTFTNADIVSMKITGGLYTGYTQSYGGTFSRRLRLQVRTANPSSIPLRATVIPSLRTATPTDGAWNSLGTFFIDHREYDVGSGVLTIDAYDAMIKAEALYTFGTQTVTEASLVSALASAIGVTADSRNALSNYTLDALDDGYTCREILKYLAVIEGGNWIITADNKLRLIRDGMGLVRETWSPTITRGAYIGTTSGKTASGAGYCRTGVWNAWNLNSTPVRAGMRLTNSNYQCRITYYDGSGNVSTGAGFMQSISETANDYASGDKWFNTQGVQFAVSFRKTNGTNMTATDATTIGQSLQVYVFRSGATPDNVNLTNSFVFDMKDGQNNVAIGGKIALSDTKGTTYEAGSGDGVIELSSPWASQLIADNLAEQLGSATYVPYSMDALISPEMEVGDTLTYNGTTYVISDFSQNFTQLFRADVGVPGSSELDHEWTFETSSARSYKRTITNLYAADASLEVREGVIEGKVQGLEGNYASLIIEVGSISLEVSSVSSSLDAVSSTVANLTVDVSGITQSVTQLTSTVSGIESSVSTLSVQVGTISAEVSSMSSNKLDKTGGNSNTFGWALTSTAFLLYSNSSTVFKCNSSGIEVNGTITAWDGKIADWDIEQNYIGTAGAAADTFFLSQTGKSAWVSQASANKNCIIYSAGNFAVTNGGILYANNAVISGDITATSGTFTGTVYASSGTFTGAVTATSGSFGSASTTNKITIGSETQVSGKTSAVIYTDYGQSSAEYKTFGGAGIREGTDQYGPSSLYGSVMYLGSKGLSFKQLTNSSDVSYSYQDICSALAPGALMIQKNTGTSNSPIWYAIRINHERVEFFYSTGATAPRKMTQAELSNAFKGAIGFSGVDGKMHLYGTWA